MRWLGYYTLEEYLDTSAHEVLGPVTNSFGKARAKKQKVKTT